MCVEQKVSCSCTCPPNSFERSDHIVFGFPNRARARFLVQSAPLGWHKSMALCRTGARICTSRMTCVAREPTPTHSVRNVPAREGALHKFFVRAHDLGKPKTLAASLECMRISSALALLVPHGTTDHEGLGP